MENSETKFIGQGWRNQYGGTLIKVKKAEILALEENAYGEVEMYLGERKFQDPKSKATHYVKLNEKKPKTEDLPF